MLCPNCMARTRVIGTETSFENLRYRKCKDCGYSFTTIEKFLDGVNAHLPTDISDKESMTNKVVQEYTS